MVAIEGACYIYGYINYAGRMNLMRRCSNSSKVSRIMGYLLYGIISYMCIHVWIFCFIKIMSIDISSIHVSDFWVAGLFVMMTGVFLNLFYIMCIETLLGDSTYKVDESGITYCYIPKREKTYTWDKIDEISVCDVGQIECDSKSFYFVIRIVIGEETDGPKNQKCKRDIMNNEVWRKSSYQRKNRDKIIMIDYTEEKYLEIKNASGKEIKDYRLTKKAKEIKLPE